MKQVHEINVLSKMENIAITPLSLNETSLQTIEQTTIKFRNTTHLLFWAI